MDIETKITNHRPNLTEIEFVKGAQILSLYIREKTVTMTVEKEGKIVDQTCEGMGLIHRINRFLRENTNE